MDMFTFVVCLVLIAIVLGVAVLQRTYDAVPRKELKRQAQAGHQLAALLYRAVSYEASLRLLLWIILGLSSAELFVIIARSTTNLLALATITVLLLAAYVWVPKGALGPVGVRLAQWLTPAVAWLLEKLHPVLDRISTFVIEHRNLSVHTGMYEKGDILEILNRQKTQADSRIDKVELEIASRALTFGDKLVRDVMVPKRLAKTVKPDDDIGPVMMDELHKSGFSRFPVAEGKAGKIVGTLYLRDLIGIQDTKKAKDVMSKEVYYANENAPLHSVLQAFLKTKHHLFVVVNEFEEMSGIITIEDVLEQIIGKPIIDEFDRYDDIRAVALSLAAKEKDEHAPTEVVE